MYFKKKNGVLSHRLVMGIKPFNRPKLLRQGMSHSECCVIPRISSALFFFFSFIRVYLLYNAVVSLCCTAKWISFMYTYIPSVTQSLE